MFYYCWNIKCMSISTTVLGLDQPISPFNSAKFTRYIIHDLYKHQRFYVKSPFPINLYSGFSETNCFHTSSRPGKSVKQICIK